MKSPFILGILLAVNACNEAPTQKTIPTQQEVNRGMEDINRQFALDEKLMIDAYIERRELTMSRTGTGLRYYIYENGEGALAKNEQLAEVNYKVSLLDGTEVYSSEGNGSKSFMIGHDNIESGLHEGILLMNVGAKALFILPTHLAHGLTGDNEKIPPRSSVVYDIELVSLK
jgi:FKBP-type peptidyl-prolyl cis-trans isomerase FkpA